uniref:Uncharacterized protein n=1 Tax=Glossina palpalis gambiensis TaxID=67801 RepID=A0A1B0BV41_9MUSC
MKNISHKLTKKISDEISPRDKKKHLTIMNTDTNKTWFGYRLIYDFACFTVLMRLVISLSDGFFGCMFTLGRIIPCPLSEMILRHIPGTSSLFYQ